MLKFKVGSCYLVPGTGQNLDLGHGGDAGQRLAPEAKAGNGVEVIHSVDLARGVAVEGKLDLIGGDADAVIADTDQAHPTTAGFDGDLGRAGIQRVLDTLLDHRGGQLHQLAGSDLGDDFRL